ncbi:hypothetical protein WR25_14848 [Diploscapter pachys]|uniref:ubiquitinyl hydrolase 1 n=1 Tax=Diploscapter pachys TaxID=2018661 RepID=A0A2A2KND7_9BILA|nr:hypothetical protein WR25_14848 [Diploscapter pachys]
MWDWFWKLPSWVTCFLSGVDCERFGRHTHEHASAESNPPTGKEKDQDSSRRVSAARYMQPKSSNEAAHEKSDFVKPNPKIFSKRIEEAKETTTKSSTSDAETLPKIDSGLTEINWQRAYVACARWDGDETMKKSVRSHKASKKVELKEEPSPDYDTVMKFRIKTHEELSLEEEECKRKQLKPMANKEISPDEIFVRHHSQLSAKSQSQKVRNFETSPPYNPYKYIDEEPVSKEDVDVHTEISKRMDPESPEIGVSIPFENQFSRASSGADMKEDSMSSDASEDGDACSRPRKKSEDLDKEYDNAPLAFHGQYFPRRTLSEMSEEMEKHESIEQTRSPKSSMSQDSGSGNEAEEARIHQLMRKSLHTQVEEYLELRKAYEETRYPLVPLPDRSNKPQQVVPPLSHKTKEALLAIYESMADRVRNNVAINTGKRPFFQTPGCTGLYNMGNTCFMNATLQALFHTPGFRDIFTRDVFLNKINEYNSFSTKGVISSVFSALMDIAWGGQLVAFKPDRFLQLFANQVNKTLADGHQHDASEFHLFLLDSLHEDMNRVISRKSFEQNYKGGEDIVANADDYARNNRLFSSSPVYDVFNLQTVSELSCSSCGERSAKFEECSLISLELPVGQTSASLKDCLKAHFSQTNLEGDSRWNCPKCKKARNATRRTKIWTLPPVLVIHLKRFSLSNGEYVKNIMQVNFDAENLEFDRHLHEKAPRSAATNVPYQLYAVTTSCAYLLYYKRKSVGTMTRM